MYTFSKVMGDIIGLREGDPYEIHEGLIKMIRAAFEIFKNHESYRKLPVLPAIQSDTSNFYWNDPEMVQSVIREYEKTKTDSLGYVLPCIHQFGSAQPLPNNKNFFKHLEQNIQYSREWGARNITIHLPISPNNDTENVISVLTSTKFIELMSQPKEAPNYRYISLDLENNHHNSFFGNLDNVAEFLDTLDQRYKQLGVPHLSEAINLCFDFGHYISQATKLKYEKTEMLRRFFQRMRHRIKTLHLHMNDGSDDQHILVGLMPDNANKIGNMVVNADLLREHTKILLDTLPFLELHKERNWIVVAETDKPYTVETLGKCFITFAELLAK